MKRIALLAPVLAGLALAAPASAQDLGTILQQVAPQILGVPQQPQLLPQDDRNRNGVPDWNERQGFRDDNRNGVPDREERRLMRADRNGDGYVDGREERRALRDEERRLEERQRELDRRRWELEQGRRW